MQPSHISEFDIANSPDEPRVPNILRSKHKRQASQKASSRHKHPQEVIVDANQFNYGRTSEHFSPFSKGIRAEIDTCLNAVEVVYQQQRLRKAERQKRNWNNTQQNMPVIGDNAIHRIDTSLILDFLSAIDQDYDIKNRFPAYGLSKNKLFRDSLVEDEDKFGSAPRRSHKNYLNLTLSAHSKRNVSAMKNKGNERETYINNVSITHSNHHAHYLQQAQSNIKKVQTQKSRAESNKKIKEDFRYCISCEKPILLQNIDYHEQNECPNLRQLYQLSFQELKQFVSTKIQKCKVTIRSNIYLMKREGNDSSSITHFEQLCAAMLSNMESCAGGSVDYERQIAEFQQKYGRFKSSVNNIFTESVDLIHKLNSFTQSYSQLLQHRDRQAGSFSQGRHSTGTKATPAIKRKANPEATTSVQQNQLQKRIRMPLISQFGESVL